jgi:hypothetical protein
MLNITIMRLKLIYNVAKFFVYIIQSCLKYILLFLSQSFKRLKYISFRQNY